jgi:hypothetical protein
MSRIPKNTAQTLSRIFGNAAHGLALFALMHRSPGGGIDPTRFAANWERRITSRLHKQRIDSTVQGCQTPSKHHFA